MASYITTTVNVRAAAKRELPRPSIMAIAVVIPCSLGDRRGMYMGRSDQRLGTINSTASAI
jgi:hypothetical protein